MPTLSLNAPLVRPPTIFVIDDSEPARESTRLLLEAHGHDVATYPSAGAFLAEAGYRPGDCLLLDNHMPEMTGIELAQILKATGSPFPIIMFTGGGDAGLKDRAARAGVLMVLDKPVNQDHLLQAIAIARADAG